MKRVREFANERPVIFSICMIICAVALIYLPLDVAFTGILPEDIAGKLGGTIIQTLTGIGALWLMIQLGLTRDSKCRLFGKELWVTWPMVLIIGLNFCDLFMGTIVIDTSNILKIVLFVTVYLSTGLVEEAVCRGLIQRHLLRAWGNTTRAAYFAVIVTSLLFGTSHFIHYFLGKMSLSAALLQVGYATCIGIFFGACALRNKSILPVILLHGLFDISSELKEIAVGGGIDKSYITTTPEKALVCMLIWTPFMIYGFWLMRKSKWKGNENEAEQIVNCG